MSFRFRHLLIDYAVWLYITGCLMFIINSQAETNLPWWMVLFVSYGFAVLSSLFQTDLGKHLSRQPAVQVQQNSNESRALPLPLKWYRTLWGWQVTLALLVTFVTGWLVVEIQPAKFFMQFSNAKGIVSGIFHPDTTALLSMVKALMETIFLALMSTVFAIPFAFAISFFAARNLMSRTRLGKTIYILIRTLATVVRSIEAIVWAIIFCVWVGIGPFAGMLALWVHSIASLIKLYSEQIENIDPGPVEAIKATGASTLQVWRYAVIPQILSPYLAFTIYRWDINVRMATIVGFVGGGGIGLALQQQQQMLAWRNVGLIMWLIALVVWVMDILSGAVRQNLTEL